MADAPAPAAAPESSAPAPATGGEQSFISKMMESVNAPEASPEPQPEQKPKSEEAPKGEKKPDKEAKPEAKPGDKPADKSKEKEDGIPALRKRYDELSASEKAKAKEIESLNKKLKDLEGKRVWSADDDKRIEQYENRIKELHGQLSEADYTRSQEYISKYVNPWHAAVKETVDLTKQMQVFTDDGQSTRAGTEADFLKVINAPAAEQGAIARKIFGDNAPTIVSRVAELTRMSREANQAIKAATESRTKADGEKAEMARRERQLYEGSREAAINELKEQYPQFFGEPEDNPQVAQAMRSGYEWVDSQMAASESASPEERAAIAAVIRARAAAFQRQNVELNAERAKVKSLEAELAKYRKSEPGAEKERGDAAKQPEAGAPAVGGVEAMAKQIAEAARSTE